MNDAPKLNRFGKTYLPPLTQAQKDILVEEFAKGAGPTAAAKAAGCGEPKARAFRNDQKTAQALKDLQVTTAITQGVNKLLTLVADQTRAITALTKQMDRMQSELSKTRAAVSYQKIGLTKARKALRDTRAENKALRKLLHRKTGLMPE